MTTSDTLPRWQLAAPSPIVRLLLCALALLLPMTLAIALPLDVFRAAARQVSGQTPLTPAIGACVLIVCLALLVGVMLARRLLRHRLSLEHGTLEVATSFYRRSYALAELQLDAARVIDLDERTEYKPRLKTNGVSLPGFHSGWFRLRNGGKALVATTGGPRVLQLPTRKGHDLLLQPVHPAALLDELKRLAEPIRRR
ncbi:PH domain-containing protein [Luteimonas sp. RIT-PG2_3]